MNLISKFFEESFELQGKSLNTIVIENKAYFRKLINSLINCYVEKTSDFQILDENKIINFQREVEIIIDIINLNPNSSKIINRLYSDLLDSISSEDLYQMGIEFESNLYNFIENLIYNYEYDLKYENIDYKNLFKAINLEIDIKLNGMMSNLIEYIDISYKLLGQRIFFILNLDVFFDEIELHDLNEYLCYNDVIVICLQNRLDRGLLENENIKIIDQDLCEI